MAKVHKKVHTTKQIIINIKHNITIYRFIVLASCLAIYYHKISNFELSKFLQNKNM